MQQIFLQILPYLLLALASLNKLQIIFLKKDISEVLRKDYHLGPCDPPVGHTKINLKNGAVPVDRIIKTPLVANVLK